MEIITFPNGIFSSNAYLLYEDDRGILIDAGVQKDRILKKVWEKGINVEDIILTHGHIDHIFYVDELKKALQAKVSIHTADANSFKHSHLNGSLLLDSPKSFEGADREIIEGDSFVIGQKMMKVIHTPGHTVGSISLYIEGHVFTGDTLFKGSIGRTDLLGGSMNQLMYSIKNKLFILPDDTIVYSGHGQNSTIGSEKKYNPYVG